VALDAKSAVEEEFAKLKAEAGSGDLSQATSNGDES
jgi:hypothetical protein